MELVNSTRMVAGYTMGLEPSGRELLVVVVKGTFGIPASGEPLRLADEQMPLIMADTFTGEPGVSAPMQEVDFAPRKHRCDVLLNGSAYAPDGRPVPRVEVGVRIGAMVKAFRVVGSRSWQSGLRGVTATAPTPFATMPISYDHAFGGVDAHHDDPSKHAAFMANPVGAGFHKHLRPEWVDGSPLPNTEELDRPILTPDSEQPVPMAFGPYGRSWQPRSKYAGTYDDDWVDRHFPFLPPDFGDEYYQAAPADQQIAHPQGGEEIVLVNLSKEGYTAFTLPTFDAPIYFFLKNGLREDGRLSLDTIVLEPDARRLTLTWRATRPLRRSIFEVSQTVVGKRTRAWWAERAVVFPLRLVMSASASKPDVQELAPTERP